MMIAKTVGLFLMISKTIIYPSLLLSSSSLGNHEYSPCLHEFFTVSTEISFFAYNPHCAMSCLIGGLVVPFIRPSAIVQLSHLICKCGCQYQQVGTSMCIHQEYVPLPHPEPVSDSLQMSLLMASVGVQEQDGYNIFWTSDDIRL